MSMDQPQDLARHLDKVHCNVAVHLREGSKIRQITAEAFKGRIKIFIGFWHQGLVPLRG